MKTFTSLSFRKKGKPQLTMLVEIVLESPVLEMLSLFLHAPKLTVWRSNDHVVFHKHTGNRPIHGTVVNFKYTTHAATAATYLKPRASSSQIAWFTNDLDFKQRGTFLQSI